MTRHPGLWIPEYTNLALVLGIVWNMTQKPGTASAIVTLVIAYAVGVARRCCSRGHLWTRPSGDRAEPGSAASARPRIDSFARERVHDPAARRVDLGCV